MRWTAIVVGVTVVVGCGDTTSKVVPDLSFNGGIDVVEGGSTSLVIRAVEPPTAELHGSFDLGAHDDQLEVVPSSFTLSPLKDSVEVRISGRIDSDSTDATAHIYVGLDDGKRADLQVVILDEQVQRAIPSVWLVTMPQSSTATFDVHLTQPPSAPATVRVVSNNVSAVYGKPFNLVFDANNYNVPQTVTLTSLEKLWGPEDVFLYSDFPTTTITVYPAN